MLLSMEYIIADISSILRWYGHSIILSVSAWRSFRDLDIVTMMMMTMMMMMMMIIMMMIMMIMLMITVIVMVVVTVMVMMIILKLLHSCSYVHIHKYNTWTGMAEAYDMWKKTHGRGQKRSKVYL